LLPYFTPAAGTGPPVIVVHFPLGDREYRMPQIGPYAH